jgi:hypothetical protein
VTIVVMGSDDVIIITHTHTHTEQWSLRREPTVEELVIFYHT